MTITDLDHLTQEGLEALAQETSTTVSALRRAQE